MGLSTTSRGTLMFGAAAALVCAGAGQARAQDEEAPGYLRTPIAAPSRAFEIGVNAGYTQGFGLLTASRPPSGPAREALVLPRGGMTDVAGAGVGFGLDLGYRATPMFRVSWSGQYEEFSPGATMSAGRARGVVTTAEVAAHLSPYSRVDPWIAVGSGYRFLWSMPEGPNNDVLTHGIQVGRLRVGADIRTSESLAVGPFIGADLNYFLWQNPEGPVGDRPIDGRGFSTFVYAGVAGTFDVAGFRNEEGGARRTAVR